MAEVRGTERRVKDRMGSRGLITGLITGLLAGSAAALLIAPKPGKVTRRYVKRKRTGYVGALRERIGRVRARLN